jgi:ribosomal protein L16 Arg81 hydroxylase
MQQHLNSQQSFGESLSEIKKMEQALNKKISASVESLGELIKAQAKTQQRLGKRVTNLETKQTNRVPDKPRDLNVSVHSKRSTKMSSRKENVFNNGNTFSPRSAHSTPSRLRSEPPFSSKDDFE